MAPGGIPDTGSVSTDKPADETPAASDTGDPYTEEELVFHRDGMEIYGKLYRPTGVDSYPLVIMAHGLGGNHIQGITMAKRFALARVAAYTFDFIGGGKVCQSDGSTTDMSILTQAADLMAVLDGFLAMPAVERNNIFLYGASQGGYVATYVCPLFAGQRG